VAVEYGTNRVLTLDVDALRRAETALSIIDWIDGPGLVASAISTSADFARSFFFEIFVAITASRAPAIEITRKA
jgi:hypothetical protein